MKPTTLEELASKWENEAAVLHQMAAGANPISSAARISKSDSLDQCARELREFSACQSERLTAGILRVASQCNSWAEYRADGEEHLRIIEKMLRDLIEPPKGSTP